jgi:hypothetical protein
MAGLKSLRVMACVVVLVTACGKQPVVLRDEDRRMLPTSGPLHPLYHVSPRFVVVTEGQDVGGFLGGLLFGLLFLPLAAMMDSASPELDKAYQLEDPVRRIHERVLADVVKAWQLPDVREPETTSGWIDPKSLQQRFRQGIVFEMGTVSWGLWYTSWSRFHLDYQAQGRLVRLADGQELWFERCVINKEDKDHDPKLDGFKADNGALIKAKLQEAEDACVKEFQTKLTGPVQTVQSP